MQFIGYIGCVMCSQVQVYTLKKENMAPRVKFTKEQIIAFSFEIARKKGIDAVTAREVAAYLKTSPRPIFTWFDTMEELKLEVYKLAKKRFEEAISVGLTEKHPILGVCKQTVSFAKGDPELYKLIFLDKSLRIEDSEPTTLKYLQKLIRDSMAQKYGVDIMVANNYSRNLFLTTFALSTIMATDSCPYTDTEIEAILTASVQYGE